MDKNNMVESDNEFKSKVIEFSKAMEKFEKNRWYEQLKILVSLNIVLLQIVTIFNLVYAYHGANPCFLMLAFIFAYIITDFVNGLVHMYMDNNTHYSSIFGPFIVSFHLHHVKLRYQNRHPLKIYFYESGTKFWLLVYLWIIALCQIKFQMTDGLNIFLVSIGVLSSVAEVSHYWCHNATSKNTVITQLQKYHVLLSKRHHRAHHVSDNVQYAFLNGISDPILNRISAYLYKGYKNYAEKHTRAYIRKLACNQGGRTVISIINDF